MEDIPSLTSAIASGDPDAFARLYKRKFGLIYGVVHKATHFHEDACLDVVQDAMMRIIRRIKPMQDEAGLDAWLVCVARTTSYDHLRRERRRLRHERRQAKGMAGAPLAAAHEVDERIAALRARFQGLDGLTAGILELRFRAGLTLAAIGKRLGLKPGAVHGRLTRGIDHLRRAVDADGRDE